MNEKHTNTVFFRGGGFNNYKVNAAIEKNFENKKFWKKNTFFTRITVPYFSVEMISDKEFLQLKDNKCIVCRQSNISENTKTCVYFVNARKS